MESWEGHEPIGQRYRQNAVVDRVEAAPSIGAARRRRHSAAAVTCPACGEASTEVWRRARPSDPRLAARAGYQLARCDACGTAFLRARAREDAAALYRLGTYGETATVAHVALTPLKWIYDRERMRVLRRLRPGARVLEVGAREGRFVRRLRRAGFEAHGLDPFAKSPDVTRAPLDDVELPGRSQDAVVLWHTLEHLDDPEAALRRIRHWLEPHGSVVIAVPNAAGLQARIGGDRWFHQDIPRHRTQFTPLGMQRLLERAGFRVEEVRHVLVEQSVLGMWLTLLNRVTSEPDVVFRLVKRDLPHGSRAAAVRDVVVATVLGLPLIPFATALELAAAARGRGGTFVVRASRLPEAAA
jgi:SAM-dependent methyltransferase